jgi:predicted CXXCH cytochrome family protein
MLLLAAGLVAADWWTCLPEEIQASYLGRDRCARCHEQQFQRWTGSHHDLAMDMATPETVLGDFDDQEFTHFGTTSRMFRQEGRYLIHTDGPGGQMRDYEIKYVFGVDPLQQYMVEFPDGRVQVLSIAWDTHKKRWFHLYPDEAIPHDDVLHWTRPAQNWNYMCAECHSTNLEKNYDLKSNTYHTTFSEIDVSCEACHGPGSVHVELAEKASLFWDRRHGYGLPKLKDKSSKTQLETCARCHSRRRIVHPDYHPGHEFLDHYEPELLDGNLYHADGQILEEVYEYGSFLQSLMYRKGVRCTDCHEPHTARLRAEGNQLCSRCHVPAKYDTPLHHHHQAGSTGASCVECHMPQRTYMVVDPRRDHSIRVPRPDLTVTLGTPNACNGCHDRLDKEAGRQPRTAEWARDQVIAWYGPKRRDDPHYALALAAGRSRELETLPTAEETASASRAGQYPSPTSRPQPADVRPPGQASSADSASSRTRDPREVEQEIVSRLVRLVNQRDASPIVRASAVALLGGYATPESFETVQAALKDKEAQVRVSAVRAVEPLVDVRPSDVASLGGLPPDHAQVVLAQLRQLQQLLAPLLKDPIRVVRVEAARVLSIVPEAELGRDSREALAKALAEFEAGQMATSDQAAAHLNLGVVYGNQQRHGKAEQAYRTALRLDPDFVPARINLAMQYDQQGRKEEAEKLFREVTRLAPQLAEAHYSLGLLLAEDSERISEAAEHLAKAAELSPRNPRIHYNLGLARQQLGKPAEAEKALLAALELAPRSPDYLHALAVFYSQQRNWPRALACTAELIRLDPQEPVWKQLHAQFQQQSRSQPIGPQPFGPSPR